VGVFTALGATELGDLAAVFDLGTVQRYESIAAGTINTNFELATDRGRRSSPKLAGRTPSACASGRACFRGATVTTSSRIT
jgi:hypothetical protein